MRKKLILKRRTLKSPSTALLTTTKIPETKSGTKWWRRMSPKDAATIEKNSKVWFTIHREKYPFVVETSIEKWSLPHPFDTHEHHIRAPFPVSKIALWGFKSEQLRRKFISIHGGKKVDEKRKAK